MANSTVPIVHSVADIYFEEDLGTEENRWTQLTDRFRADYGIPPQFVTRSPGRVNLIGEHIDYSLYSVIPMAITADVLLAVSTNVSQAPHAFKVRISNINPKYPSREFELHPDAIEIDGKNHEWTNYFKSGLRCALEMLRKKHGSGFKPKSMQVLLDGTVPAGSGLSSSAAFTTASALSVLFANGETEIDKIQLTELAIVSERAAGVNSGGMDQSASVFSVRGSALYVSFNPSLAATPIAFPPTSPELKFLIAQSFVVSDKSVSGPVCYNLRVVECTLAAAYLQAKLDKSKTLPSDAAPLRISLHGLHSTYFANTTKPPEQQLNEFIRLTKEILMQEEGYTREEIASALEISVSELEQRFMSKVPVRAVRFKLRQRALHVFSEGVRVLQFYNLLNNPSSTLEKDSNNSKTFNKTQNPTSTPEKDSNSTETFNETLGDIMNAAQESARDMYECSCPELDQLCEIARRAGSYGSRLTGAGWGGCSVHLVAADRVDAVRKAWERGYYSKMDLSEEQKAAAVVVSKPGSGSAVFVVGDGEIA